MFENRTQEDFRRTRGKKQAIHKMDSPFFELRQALWADIIVTRHADKFIIPS
jgi:hypothetical protein